MGQLEKTEKKKNLFSKCIQIPLNAETKPFKPSIPQEAMSFGKIGGWFEMRFLLVSLAPLSEVLFF